MTDSPVLFEARGKTAIITLNRPEARNAVNEPLTKGVNEAWERFEGDPGLRVAIITGAGRQAFCAGADLKEVAEAFKEPSADLGVHDNFGFPMSPHSHGVTKPVIAAVNGAAVGAGLTFVMEADLVIASENATFIDPHPRWAGINPDIIEQWGRLPFGWTTRLVFGGTGQRLSAQDAYRLGLVGEVVEADRLLERALQISKELQTAPDAALRAQKEAIWSGYRAITDRALQRSREIRMDFRKRGGKSLLADRTAGFGSANATD